MRGALVAAVLLSARAAAAQPSTTGTWQLTQYWIAAESPVAGDRRAVPVRDRHGRVLAQACESFASCLCMEGTGRTWDGRLLNWDARVEGRACFTEVDTNLFPYGVGVQGYALVPYRSLAVDSRYIPIGHVVEIPALQGLPLPDGAVHDGCFVAVDGGGAINGHHIDLFLPSIEAWRRLGRGNFLPSRVTVEVDAPRCAYASRFAVHPVPGDPLPDLRFHRELPAPPSADAGAATAVPPPRARH
jgi:3D (Asp-Asp-Asp) domain-containing protein